MPVDLLESLPMDLFDYHSFNRVTFENYNFREIHSFGVEMTYRSTSKLSVVGSNLFETGGILTDDHCHIAYSVGLSTKFDSTMDCYTVLLLT